MMDWLVWTTVGLSVAGMACGVTHAIVTRTYELLTFISLTTFYVCFIVIMALLAQEQIALARLAVLP